MEEQTHKIISEADAPLSPVFLIAKMTWIDFLRRRDLFVAFIFMFIYAMFVFVVKIVGVESIQTVIFLLNLGLTVSAGIVSVLVILASSRQIPDELENRTAFPLFAKPLERGEYILGKVVAISAIGIILLSMFFTITRSILPDVSILDSTLFIEMFLIQIFSIVMLTSLSLFLSLIFTKTISIIILIILYFWSGILLQTLKSQFSGGFFSSAANIILSYIPSFQTLNLIQRYTDGGTALTSFEFSALIVYAVLTTASSIILCSIFFERKAL